MLAGSLRRRAEGERYGREVWDTMKNKKQAVRRSQPRRAVLTVCLLCVFGVLGGACGTSNATPSHTHDKVPATATSSTSNPAP
jgi:hypothetical protein